MTEFSDDFDVDEHGILRAKEITLEDQGIILDDEGILRDEGDRYSHYTFNTDSGFGTAERKSSSSLNKLPGSNFEGVHNQLDDYRDEILDGKRISDFEVSESVQGELSYDQASIASGVGDSDLPYYEESYTTDQSSRREYEYGSTTDQSNAEYVGHGYEDSYEIEGDFDQYYDHYQEPDSYRDGQYDVEGSSISFLNSGELDPKLIQPADKDKSVKQIKYSEKVRPQSRGSNNQLLSSEGAVGGNDSINYLLGSYKKIAPAQKSEGVESHDEDGGQNHDTDEVFDASKQYGRSIFTQEDSHEAKHSLLEFEAIEASIQAVEALDGNEETDLIGAYLNSVEQQDREDEEVRSSGSAADEDITSVSQQFQPEDLQQIQGHSKPDFVPDLKFGDSITGSQSLEDSQEAVDLTTQGSAVRPTRIPLLRSRSPSMSRPGSTSPTRARYLHTPTEGSSLPLRPERGRSPIRPLNHRSLPSTPDVHAEPSSRPGSRSGIPRWRSPSPGQGNKIRGRSPGSELDNAAAMLMSDGELSKNSSADPVKSTVKDKLKTEKEGDKRSPFKIRRSPSPTKREPMRALPEMIAHKSAAAVDSGEETGRSDLSKLELSRKLQEEKQQRKIEEEYYKHLMDEHNRLQKNLAEAENVIDELRTGAKVSLYADSPTPSQGRSGSMQAAKQLQTFNIAKMGTATLAGGTQPQRATLSNPAESRSASRGSQQHERPTSAGLGVMVDSSTDAAGAAAAAADENEELSKTLSEDSTKMALLLQGKGLDEKLDAFQTLLDGNHLSVEEQQQALNNIKESYEQLQTEYRQAKEEHDRSRRKAGSQQQFDAGNEMNGELYKLGMKLDGLEHRVQESQQLKSNQRVPFSRTPLKANHDLKVDQVDGGTHGSVVSPNSVSNRPPSVSSVAGAPSDIDEQLHTLQKDYDKLMDHYRRLKQTPRTPRRDQEVDSLLKKLKNIYEQTPEHRKPPLPPELENRYDAKEGTFVPPEKLEKEETAKRRHRLEKDPFVSHRRTSHPIRSRRKPMSDTEASTSIGDLSIQDKTPSSHQRQHPTDHSNRQTVGHDSDKHNRARKPSDVSTTSRVTDSDASTVYSRRTRGRGPRQAADDSRASEYMSSTSDHTTPRKKRLPTRPMRHADRTNSVDPSSQAAAGQKHARSARRREPDKDSGYVGSEVSRRLAAQSPTKDSHNRRPGTAAGRHLKTSALEPERDILEEPSSDSDASTVEYRTPRRTITASSYPRKGEEASARSRSRRRSHGSGSDGAHRPRSRLAGVYPSDTDETYTSGGSRETIKSAKLESLQRQLTELKDRMDSPHTVPYMQQGAPLAADAAAYQYPPSSVAAPYQPRNAAWDYGAFVSGPGRQGRQPGQTRDYQRSDPLGGSRAQRSTSPYRNREGSPYRRRAASPIRGDFSDPGGRGRMSTWERGRENVRHSTRDKYNDDLSASDEDYNDGAYPDRDASPEARYERIRDYYVPTGRNRGSRDPYYSHYTADGSYDNQGRNDTAYLYPDDSYSVQPRSRPVTPAGVGVSGRTTPCPMCGGQGFHTHEGYVHQASQNQMVTPQPIMATPQVPVQGANYASNSAVPGYVPTSSTVPGVGQPGMGYVGQGNSSSNQLGVPVHRLVQVVPQPAANSGHVYVPVPNTTPVGKMASRALKVKSSPKVRYYVREYGADSSADDTRGAPVKSVSRTTRKYMHEGAYSDGEVEVDEELDSSLAIAAKTAKQLKKLSGQMKSSLIEELNVSYRNTSLLSALI